MEPVYTSVIGVARALFAAQGIKFRIRGAENVPRTGGAVFAINHTGYMDFTYAGLAAHPAKRLVRFMAKESIWKNPVAGPLMTGMKHIPVDREAGGASFRAAINALKAGEIVGVFPEATISRSFELKEFKSGTVRMAQAAGVPIIPVTIWGSQRVWTKGYPKRLGRTNIPIYITVGEPIPVGKGSAAAEQVNELLRERMSAQLHADQDAYPPLGPDERQFLPVRLGGTAPTLEEANALDEEEVRRRAGRDAEHRRQGVPLRSGETVQAVEHRAAQLVQGSERQLHLRLHARCPRHPASRRPPGEVVQQHGLAHTGLTAHYQRPALTGPHTSNEPVKCATFAEPAGQPCGGTPDTRMCRHRVGARKQPWRRHRLL